MTAITTLAAATAAYTARPRSFRAPSKVSIGMWSRDDRDETQSAMTKAQAILDRAIAELATLADGLDDKGAAFDIAGLGASINDAFLDASKAYDEAVDAFDDENSPAMAAE